MPQDKMRKSEEQKRLEEAENAGRLAGNDAESQQARARYEESSRQEARRAEEHQRSQMGDGQVLDADAVRPAQGNMLNEEAQNINKDRGDADLLEGEEETKNARNKAMQGKEGRDTDSSNDGSRYSGSR